MTPFEANNLRPFLKGKKIFLGISGSIAAFKAQDLVRILKEVGAEVQVGLSESASKFVTPLTLETLSDRKVLTSMWDSDQVGTHHIDLARWADVFLFAPASAGLLGRLAHGLASDLLSAEYLTFDGPVLIAPAMNPTMFSHPAVQENMKLLHSRGCGILGPVEGVTSCGEEGLGRFMEPLDIVLLLARCISPKQEKKVLVSMGATRSQFDPVRYWTNRSSGKMGASLAWAAFLSGYDVRVVSGPNSMPLPPGVEVVYSGSVKEMDEAIEEVWSDTDIFFSSAAVLDYEFSKTSDQKQKKSEEEIELKMTRTPDLLKKYGAMKKSTQTIIGFAAETENWIDNARKKLISKNCDAVFVNDVSQPDIGFEADKNSGFLVTKDDAIEFKKKIKPEIALELLDSAIALSERGVDSRKTLGKIRKISERDFKA